MSYNSDQKIIMIIRLSILITFKQGLTSEIGSVCLDVCLAHVYMAYALVFINISIKIIP